MHPFESFFRIRFSSADVLGQQLVFCGVSGMICEHLKLKPLQTAVMVYHKIMDDYRCMKKFREQGRGWITVQVNKFHPSPFPAVSQTRGRRSVPLDACTCYQPALENLSFYSQFYLPVIFQVFLQLSRCLIPRDKSRIEGKIFSK